MQSYHIGSQRKQTYAKRYPTKAAHCALVCETTLMKIKEVVVILGGNKYGQITLAG